MTPEIKPMTVDDYLNVVDYSDDPNYVPSDFALHYLAFIKMVNGAEGEENKTPVIHLKMLDTLIKEQDTANLLFRGAAKALSLDTQILTPLGNKTVEELSAGDSVFDRNGKVTFVLAKSEVFNKPMYELVLADGRKLKVSEDHINIVRKRTSVSSGSRLEFKEYELTTKELLEKGVTYNRTVSDRNPSGQENKWFIPTASAIELCEIDSPIDPYTVGLILGDGSIGETGYSRIHCHVDDVNHYLQRIPYTCSEIKEDTRYPKVKRFGILGIGKKVKSFLGVDNCYSKRVPQALLWGSKEQRLAVLQGLMDTDGTVGDKKSSTTFTSVSEGLANDVLWLVRSLGGEGVIKTNLWNGRLSYRVHIRIGINPFTLPRKANKWVANVKGHVAIIAINKIEDTPSQCLMVSSGTKSFLAESFIVTHNTTVFGEYMFPYLAVYGELPGLKVDVALYVTDSIENGVKNMRKNLEHRWENSAFLQEYIPSIRFTDTRWEFTNIDGRSLIVKGYGAKALSLDSELFTETGRISIGECQVGDRIFGADGKLTTITAKSEVFHKPMYRLSLADGRSLKVSEDHLNPVIINTNPNNTVRWEEQVLTTQELLQQPLVHTKKGNVNHKGTSSKSLVFVKNIAPLDYPEAVLSIDPYTLGVVIGDGRIRKECGSVELTVHVNELDHYHASIPYVFGALYKDPRSHAVTQSIRGLGPRLKQMGLNVRGEQKFIPYEYFFGSISQRLELLRGLMDTDGTVSESGRLSFTSSSHQLVDDLACLVRSLGGTAGKIHKQSHALAYRVELWMELNPFRLARKAARFIPKQKHVAVVAVERIEDEPSQCIAVDNSERQFVAECYFRTHNTGVRGAKEKGKRPQFALLDDLLSDEDARSPTVIASIEDTVYKAVDNALHPTKRKVIWNGTPFNQRDPLYKAIESGGWAVNVFPVCEKFPCTRKEFKGAWPDRFSYDAVKRAYDKAVANGKADAFNQELMLRIMSQEDKLILPSDLVWYSRELVLLNKHNFNFYITTDLATSEKKSADFSVVSVWAYNSNGDWLLVDGFRERCLVDKAIEQVFRFVQIYQPQGVGIEVSGQQGGFVTWIQNEMIRKNLWFTLTSSRNSALPGIRPVADKFSRFMTVSPLFKARKIMLPNELKEDPFLVAMVEELSLVSRNGFKSKNDDTLDTISMLTEMNPWKPTNEAGMSYNPHSGLWESDDEDDGSIGSSINSYIV